MLRRILALSLSAAAVLCLAAPCWSQEKPAVIYTKDNAPAAPKLDDLALKGSVSQYGMTWTFDKPARVGQFVNGDFYVVGPVTVTESPPSLSTVPRSPPPSSTTWIRRNRKNTASGTASCSIRPRR